jgi:flagellar hook assembly protein FlgD
MMSMTSGGVDIGALSRANSSLKLAQNAATKASAATDRAASGTATAAASGGAADITGNDFLTLLVTEMKNQDPTQPTDPSAYIQQLVGVNSLEQLISINNSLSSTGASTSAGASAQPSTPPTRSLTSV